MLPRYPETQIRAPEYDFGLFQSSSTEARLHRSVRKSTLLAKLGSLCEVVHALGIIEQIATRLTNR
jgi:hypothetical protein